MKRVFDRIVFLISIVALALCATAFVDFLLHPIAPDYNFHSPLFRLAANLVFIPFTLLVGFLIIRRVPGNVVGPLLIAWSGSVAYSSIRQDIGPVIFSIYYWYDLTFGWTSLFLMFLHFPDGRIYPQGAARWIYGQLGLNILVNSLIFLSTNPLQVPSQMANPFFVPALEKQAGPILALGLLLIIPILSLAFISPVLRYRKGDLLERQQIKWLALFAGSMVIITFLGYIIYPLLTGGEVMNPGTSLVAVFFYSITSLFPPLTIGIAVLRYRLWDIDLIIRRTLVYSILAAALSLVYFVSVAALQTFFQLITRQHGSPVATVLSTLAIAALFTPLRRRIQGMIDRRFYRRRYDSEKVLAAFSSATRNEVDMETLSRSILDVVKETMQPVHVSLWLGEIEPAQKESEEAAG